MLCDQVTGLRMSGRKPNLTCFWGTFEDIGNLPNAKAQIRLEKTVFSPATSFSVRASKGRPYARDFLSPLFSPRLFEYGDTLCTSDPLWCKAIFHCRDTILVLLVFSAEIS